MFEYMPDGDISKSLIKMNLLKEPIVVTEIPIITEIENEENEEMKIDETIETTETTLYDDIIEDVNVEITNETNNETEIVKEVEAEINENEVEITKIEKIAIVTEINESSPVKEVNTNTTAVTDTTIVSKTDQLKQTSDQTNEQTTEKAAEKLTEQKTEQANKNTYETIPIIESTHNNEIENDETREFKKQRIE